MRRQPIFRIGSSRSVLDEWYFNSFSDQIARRLRVLLYWNLLGGGIFLVYFPFDSSTIPDLAVLII